MMVVVSSWSGNKRQFRFVGSGPKRATRRKPLRFRVFVTNAVRAWLQARKKSL